MPLVQVKYDCPSSAICLKGTSTNSDETFNRIFLEKKTCDVLYISLYVCIYDQPGGKGAPGYGVSLFKDQYLRRYE